MKTASRILFAITGLVGLAQLGLIAREAGELPVRPSTEAPTMLSMPAPKRPSSEAPMMLSMPPNISRTFNLLVDIQFDNTIYIGPKVDRFRKGGGQHDDPNLFRPMAGGFMKPCQ